MKKILLVIAALTGAMLLMGAAVIGYQDWQTRAAPGSNPASGYLRMWADTGTSTFKCITSAGTACTFAGATSGTVTSIATTSPITGGTITGTGTIACATCTVTIASGTSALGTSAIAGNSCATVVTTSATGTASTDTITWSPNADVSGVTGYGVLSTDGLKVYPYPTSNNVNWRVCNGTALSTTPGAVTFNWRVMR